MATISFADNGSTAVRQEASNARMVALSIRPMRYSPAAVSWMAADKRLRYLAALAFFLIIARYLPQFRLRQRGCNLRVAVTQIMLGQLFQAVQFPVVDVVALALGKATEEHAAPRGPMGNDRADATRPSAAQPGDTLLDEVPTKVGLDEAAFGASNGFTQPLVVEPFLASKACKHLGHENRKQPSQFCYTITLGVIIQDSKRFPCVRS